MESNLTLNIGLKGQLALNAQAVPMQEGYLKLGGVVDATNQSNGLKFGVVVSAPTNDPTAIVAGSNGGSNVIRGISVFDDAIAQNAMAHSDRYLGGMPCAFIAKGLLKVQNWKTSESNQIEPVIGAKVEYSNADGEIGFVASTADSNYTLLTGATVVEVTNDGAYIWLA